MTRCITFIVTGMSFLAISIAVLPRPGFAQNNLLTGTWRLNLAKSTFPGSPPNSQTVTIQGEGQGRKMTVAGITAAGHPFNVVFWQVVEDGKPHPVTGSSSIDASADTRVNAYTVNSIRMKAGKVVEIVTTVVSPDGKTLIATLIPIEANGRHSVQVYDKLALASNAPAGLTHGLSFGNEKRLEIYPVLFVPSDNNAITPQAINHISDLLYAHLELAQKRYRLLLEPDTFKIASGKLNVYRSRRPTAYYDNLTWRDSKPATGPPDVTEAILSELFAWNHDNRYQSKYIYLVLYARPGGPVELGKGKFLGSAYPFNGIDLPNKGLGYSGGGYIGIDLSMLLYSKPHGFQDTFSHELGHALGLTHVNCLGYSMIYNDSLMSYKTKPEPKDFSLDFWRSYPVIFNPEEYFILSKNKLAFPHFQYSEAKHNPTRKKFRYVATCAGYMGLPMSSYVGAFKTLPGIGFELFDGGRRVSKPEQAFLSYNQAKAECRWQKKYNKNAICRFNGKNFEPGPEPQVPNLAGMWCARPGKAPVSEEKPVRIAQAQGKLTFGAGAPVHSSGHFQPNDSDVFDMAVADDWDASEPAIISQNVNRLDWGSGFIWLRKAKCGS